MGECRRCHVETVGAARLCVLCFSRWHRPCPKCMERGTDGRYRPRKRGRPPKPVDCGTCKNERWLIMDDEGRIIE